MTTIAFVAGMLPLLLATGPGAEERRSIAVLAVGGQTLSLILTLVAVPSSTPYSTTWGRYSDASAAETDTAVRRTGRVRGPGGLSTTVRSESRAPDASPVAGMRRVCPISSSRVRYGKIFSNVTALCACADRSRMCRASTYVDSATVEGNRRDTSGTPPDPRLALSLAVAGRGRRLHRRGRVRAQRLACRARVPQAGGTDGGRLDRFVRSADWKPARPTSVNGGRSSRTRRSIA